MNTMFNATRDEIEVVFKKTLLNMLSFWFKLDRKKLLVSIGYLKEEVNSM